MNTPAQCGVIKPPQTDIYSEAPQHCGHEAAVGAIIHVLNQVAQLFTTGSHRGGYGIAQVRFEAVAPSPVDLVATVHEHDAATGGPTESALFTLSGPPTFANAYSPYTFTAPPGTELDPDTTYWLRFSSTDTSYVLIQITDEHGERRIDENWRIGNTRYNRDPSSSTWAQTILARPPRIAVDSVALPTRVEAGWGETPLLKKPDDGDHSVPDWVIPVIVTSNCERTARS